MIISPRIYVRSMRYGWMKADDLMKRLPNVTLKLRDIEEAISGNDTLSHPTMKPEAYNELFQQCKIIAQKKIKKNG